MLDIVLAFTQAGVIWFATIGVILSAIGFCFFIGGKILKYYTNKSTGYKPSLLERRANLLSWMGSIFLYFYLPVNILLIVSQIIPTNMRDFVIIMLIVIAFVGVVSATWAAIIQTKIARQHKKPEL